MAFDLNGISVNKIVGALSAIVGFFAAHKLAPASPLMKVLFGVAAIIATGFLGMNGLPHIILISVGAGMMVAGFDDLAGNRLVMGVVAAIPAPVGQ